MLLVKNEDVLPFLERCSAKRRGENELGIIHLGNDELYKADSEEVIPMIEAADCSISNERSIFLQHDVILIKHYVYIYEAPSGFL